MTTFVWKGTERKEVELHNVPGGWSYISPWTGETISFKIKHNHISRTTPVKRFKSWEWKNVKLLEQRLQGSRRCPEREPAK